MLRKSLPWLVVLIASSPLLAIDLPVDFAEELVISNLSLPNSFRFLPDGRILVCELKTARLRLWLGNGFAQTDPIGTVPGVNTAGNERGLLSIAIDPQFPSRPFVYAYYSSNLGGTDTDTRVTRFRLSGDLDGSGDGELAVDHGSALHVLSGIHDLRSNHNGGDLRFGPDGMLYLSTGDDENSRCEAQELDQLVGKILRLRVDLLDAASTGDAARAEITPGDNPFDGQGEVASLVYAYGFRNPFRFSIHPTDGSIFVCDVGHAAWEEISHIESPGLNLGWPHREGAHVVDFTVDRSLCLPEPDPFDWLPPIDEYGHTEPVAYSITGGEVYVAPPGAQGAWPSGYQDSVFYADYYGAWFVRLVGSGQNYARQIWATGAGGGVVDLLVGPDHALYYLSQVTGSLRRIVYTGPSATESTSLGALKARYGGGN